MKTCKECIHFEACVETIRAFGFDVSTDNLKQRVCPLFRNKGGNDWIPVTERLPEQGQEVIVYSGGVLKPTVSAYLFWDKHYDNWARITHWMPLPDGPESKK